MKNWRIIGFLAILIISFLLISGCTQDNSKYCSDNFPGTYYDPTTKMCEHTQIPTQQILYVTVLVTPTLTPTITATENIDSIRTKLSNEWKQIQDVYDTFTIKGEKNLIKGGNVQPSNGEINDFREKTVPNTISEYQKIKNDLLNININNSDLQEQRTILISICDYKIKYIQATSSELHAIQTKTFNLQTSLTEYKNAKQYLQDELEIINAIPYSSKYWDYVYNDKQEVENNIVSTNENILRISKKLP